MATNHLVGFGITYTHSEGLAVGVLLVESQLDSEASIAGAVHLAIGIGIQNFPGRNCCQCRCEEWE
jgi:hypothetical protein